MPQRMLTRDQPASWQDLGLVKRPCFNKIEYNQERHPVSILAPTPHKHLETCKCIALLPQEKRKKPNKQIPKSKTNRIQQPHCSHVCKGNEVSIITSWLYYLCKCLLQYSDWPRYGHYNQIQLMQGKVYFGLWFQQLMESCVWAGCCDKYEMEESSSLPGKKWKISPGLCIVLGT